MLSFSFQICAMILIVSGFVLAVCATPKWNDKDQDKVSLKMMKSGDVVVLIGILLGITSVVIK